jgi:hypothetical protein
VSKGSGGGSGGDAVSAAIGTSITKGAETLAVAPKEVITEPAAVTDNRMIGEVRSIAEPGPTPERSRWQPRQDIVQVQNRLVSEEIPNYERRPIPKIERINNARDVVAEVDRDEIGKGTGGPLGVPATGEDLVIEDLLKGSVGGGRPMGGPEGGGPNKPVLRIEEPGKGPGPKIFTEQPAQVTPLKALEKLLVAEVTVFTSMLEWKHGYFKVEIKRIGAQVLPIMPKDVLLIQDCSNSMAEQRLHFCRDGMLRCLVEIGPADRFNVVGFREHSQGCFPDWVENTPENIAKARKFIEEMKSEGNTDIFTAISEQMNVKRTPGRPVVALLVSDGVPTAGMVASTDIIGEFSKLNNGAISVFTMGTLQTANRYLIDLLSYCNRGDSQVIASGRWDIPDAMQRLMREVSRPVLAETELHFPGDCQSEVYPLLISNLYLDRALVFYGRFPKGTKTLVFQTVGRAGDVKCDMLFNLDLEKNVKQGDSSIRENWAKQKIYHLIGQNARKPDPATLTEMQATAREYGIAVPYRKQLK